MVQSQNANFPSLQSFKLQSSVRGLTGKMKSKSVSSYSFLKRCWAKIRVFFFCGKKSCVHVFCVYVTITRNCKTNGKYDKGYLFSGSKHTVKKAQHQRQTHITSQSLIVLQKKERSNPSTSNLQMCAYRSICAWQQTGRKQRLSTSPSFLIRMIIA